MSLSQQMRLAYAAWVIALLATAGSLFFSEVMGLPPCVLCWYQRVVVYPLVLVLGTGILMRDLRMKYYALPLALFGLVISIYHNLLYYRIIPESVTPCAQGVPCTERQLELFGFITIPLLGLATFIALCLCLLFMRANTQEQD